MLDYIFKRLLLLIPTLLGVMTINFLLMQLSPGGPVEQSIAKMENLSQITEAPTGSNTLYKGSVGLDSELIMLKCYGVLCASTLARAFTHNQACYQSSLKNSLCLSL